jgi:hypothetical protein
LPDFESLNDEVSTYFETRFGVARQVLAPLVFQERDREIWAAGALLPPGITSKRPPGLRILRRTPIGLKPTSTFLQLLGERITASRVEIEDVAELRRLVLGRAIRAYCPDSFVAISFRGDVLGCGMVKEEKLKALIPAGRRQALLDALLTAAQQVA